MRFNTVKTVCVLSVASLALVAVAGCSSSADTNTQVINNGTDNSLAGYTSAKIGDSVYDANQASTTFEYETVTFGNYQGQAIEWYVLDEQDGKKLLISKDILDAQPYDDGEVPAWGDQNSRNVNDVTWENCSLRAWLNDEFLNAAFSSDEQAAIQDTTVENPTPHSWTQGSDVSTSTDTYYDAETTDKVYLLSTYEMRTYMASWDARVAFGTDYALSQGLYTGVTYDANAELDDTLTGSSAYWLRTIGVYAGYGTAVLDSGEINDSGYRVDGQVHDGYTDHGQYSSDLGGNLGVRPVIWVDESALS